MIIAIDGSFSGVGFALGTDRSSLIVESCSTRDDPGKRIRALLSVGEHPLSRVIIGAGPGSFTGTRLALALGQGLAFAAQAPLLHLPTLSTVLSHRQLAVGISDARRHEWFVALASRSEPTIVSTEEVREILSSGDRRQMVTFDPVSASTWGLPLLAPAEVVTDLWEAGSRALPATAKLSPEAIGACDPLYIRAVAAKTVNQRKGI